MQHSRKTHQTYTSRDVTSESSPSIAIALALAEETFSLLIYMVIVSNQGTLLPWEIKTDDLQYANFCDYNRNYFVLCSLSFFLVNLRLSSSHSRDPWQIPKAPSHC